MGNDYDYDQRVAQDDQVDATKLQADAAELRTEAQHDYTEADSMERMGLPEQAGARRTEGQVLETRAEDFDMRAVELDVAADMSTLGRDLLMERDSAAAGATAAESHAAGAQVVLDYVDLSEEDRTRWTAEAGAATGEAAALHKRADEITGEGVVEIHAASTMEGMARTGLEGRHWAGEDTPQGEPTAGE